MTESAKNLFQNFLPVLENLLKKYFPVLRKEVFAQIISNVYQCLAVRLKTKKIYVDMNTIVCQNLGNQYDVVKRGIFRPKESHAKAKALDKRISDKMCSGKKIQSFYHRSSDVFTEFLMTKTIYSVFLLVISR